MENFRSIAQNVGAAEAAMREQGRRMRAAAEAQISLPRLLSGEAMFVAMKSAVTSLVNRVPQDHDVLIQIGDFFVTEANFIEPHTFLFEGYNQDGHRSTMVCHFSQVVVRVVYLPKREDTRFISKVIQGFNPNPPPSQ